MNPLHILILAAGSSKRLGEPKQLLKYNNESLIQITIQKALQLSPLVTVVLGYKADEIANEIQKFEVDTIINPNYAQGIGNSIAFGIQYTKESKNTLIMLCDQPFIPLEHYQQMIKNISNDSIVASKYDKKPTVPAIFPKQYYPELLSLQGDKGAKALLQIKQVKTIVLDKKYAVDIDTVEEKDKYLNESIWKSNN